jgi:hypothetical protein
MNIIKTLMPAAMLAACLTETYAVHLEIVNENKKELKVKIEPEGASRAAFIQQIPAEHYSSLDLELGQFKGKSYYSIKGDTSAFTSGGKCEHLSVEKDYKVTFQNDKVGTTCIAEEISDNN